MNLITSVSNVYHLQRRLDFLSGCLPLGTNKNFCVFQLRGEGISPEDVPLRNVHLKAEAMLAW